MKKIVILLFLVMNISFSLEISSVDPLDFGVVVVGDRNVSLEDVGVYVEGKPGRNVEIIVPEIYDLDGNKMRIRVRQKQVRLDGGGKGKFRLNIELKLDNIGEYKTITDNLSIKVRYVD